MTKQFLLCTKSIACLGQQYCSLKDMLLSSFLDTILHLRFSSFSGNFFIFAEFESKCCIKRGKLIVHTMRRRDVNNLDQGVQILGYHMKSHRDYYQVICNEQSFQKQYSDVCSFLRRADDFKLKM